MGSGLIQLVSYGKENLYLSGDPEITFFKIIYRRYTNFSIEPVEQFFKNTPDFGKRVTCSISKNADLLGRILLCVNLPSIRKSEDFNFAWVKKIGLALIKTVEIEVGGQILDRQYGDWMNIWFELNPVKNNIKGFENMIGNVKELTNFTNGKKSYLVYVPLTFWFCFSNGLALPIIALQYNEIKLYLEFNEFNKCHLQTPTNFIIVDTNIILFKEGEIIEQIIDDIEIRAYFYSFDFKSNRLYYRTIQNDFRLNWQPGRREKYKIVGKESGFECYPIRVEENSFTNKVFNPLNPSLIDAYLLVDYIYLDTRERYRFLKSNHEYLITQLQATSDINLTSSNSHISLPFLNPCSKLFWRSIMTFNISNNNLFNYTNSFDENIGKNIFKKGTITLNGVKRLDEQLNFYYDTIQPYQNFICSPSTGINVYSFSLGSKYYQPSGSCNFTQFDQIKLLANFDQSISRLNKSKFKAYALTYNVFRIIDGFGGLAFTN
ncbi:Major capsid protein N-terminus [seawater metagenome]|uniref:Major capsid protein N-terminus n=1 Tax=seawater metagenome TaxID=1561972 RepID=A0A5E8CHM1_9ZZZZ